MQKHVQKFNGSGVLGNTLAGKIIMSLRRSGWRYVPVIERELVQTNSPEEHPVSLVLTKLAMCPSLSVTTYTAYKSVAFFDVCEGSRCMSLWDA